MATKAAIGFDLLSYIHDARQTYGLRSQDYTRYRRFCANRLQRVRKSVKLSQGTMGAYKRKTVTLENACTSEHLEVLVLEAERAWAYAMDLREQYSRTEEPRQGYHVIRRLRSSVSSASLLATISASVGDDRTQLAAYAYWLQIKSQLHFQLEEFEMALDCAVCSRAISGRLAQAGTSQQYALAHALMETLDPIVRLAAYRMRVEGAQQLPPSEVAKKWYEVQVVGMPERVERAVPGYVDIAELLERFAGNGQGAEGSDEYERACTGHLIWRGGKVGFASSDLAGAIEKAQATLEEGDQAAATAFRAVERTAHRLHGESAAAAAKVQSAESDALASAYLAIQLYGVCVQHALTLAKYRRMIDSLIVDLKPFSVAAGTAEWIAAAPIKKTSGGSGKRSLVGKVAELPAGTQLVALCDLVRKTLSQLQPLVAGILARMAPSTVRLIGGNQIVDEISAAETYYSAMRSYYAAALHASPAHNSLVDALALLDIADSQELPLATTQQQQLVAMHTADQTASDALWSAQVGVSAENVQKLAEDVKKALVVVRGQCVAGASADKPKEVKGDWFSNPSARPAMAVNSLAKKRAAGAPGHVPRLVDLDAVQFAAVPVKPLFYDLAAATIDFDMDAVAAKAGKQAKQGKLSSLIGGLWGSR